MIGQVTRSKAGVNYLTEIEEKKLFNFLKLRSDVQARRDYVLLKLCRLTGIRRGEALALNVGDVAGKDRLIIDERIAEKGGTGEVSICMELQDVIAKFLKRKRFWKESLEDDAPLFISKKGERLSMRAFNDLMDKWCKAAGIARYTPHALRHTKAQRIMNDVKHLTGEEKQKALLFANRQLRHKSLSATMVYTQPTKEEMAKVGEI